MAGRLDVRGRSSLSSALAFDAIAWLRSRIGRRLVIPNTLRAARDNVHHHYDLGNSFYQQWLDRELVYTCAYFERPETSLDEAQRAKMDLVCRKLQLKPGDTVVEAGCGWGALALFMARHYGVQVKAFNVSREQLTFARERRHRRTRRVDSSTTTAERADTLCHRHARAVGSYLSPSMCLTDGASRGGRGLLHFIGRDTLCPLNPWVRRRIFPGAYPPTLAEVTTRVLVPAEMSVVDVENLRLHYARTLNCGRPRGGRTRCQTTVTSSRAPGLPRDPRRRSRQDDTAFQCVRASRVGPPS
jgi:cyclopropane-fatty-acyl-phospholipid synthase